MLDLKEIVLFIILVFSVSFVACNKAPVQSGTLEITENWQIDSEYSLIYRDAVLYENLYVVWGVDNNENPLLIAFDLELKELAWLFDFSNISGWGTKLTLVDNFLVVKDNASGLTVLDLDLKQTVTAIKFEQDYPGHEVSDTPVSIHQNQLFFTLSNPETYQSKLLCINLPSGNITEELTFESDDFMIPRMTSPSFYQDNNNETNSLVTLQLMRTDQSVARTSATLLMSLDNQFDTNWQDTINFENGTHPLKWLPIVYQGIMAVTFIDDLLVYNVNSGQKLVQQQLPKASGSKLTLDEDGGVFFAQGLKRSMQKIDINGNPQWAIGSTPAPSEFGDILVNEEYVVYVRESFGNLTVMNCKSGGEYNVVNQIQNGIANPTYSNALQLYFTHQEDKVIGFTLEEN